ncbi:TetR family transcriptional regulator [Acetobacter sp. LMG 1636]|uniref:TetR family transcriptional regulator n=2 Tax=Acetobacter fallax TaxID=1737473 RepID=A0ABX0KAI9_9PROT|nr:TetR family transcriptional regulator [Acetobacter fallax]NHO35721.1 TetR family transcriptional regulator [Acetobacter fallax]
MSEGAVHRGRAASSGQPKSDTRAAGSGEASVVERRDEILEIAATLFAERGYRATSIRDIAERAGMKAGSLYYHITSKEALFVEIHDKALDAAAARVRAVIAGCRSPWERLEAACVEMLEIQLNPESLTLPIMNNFRSVPDEVKDALIRKRDEFERIFRDIIAALPLPSAIDRTIYRILLLRLLNTADEWYREGRLTRPEIAAQIVGIFRHEAG